MDKRALSKSMPARSSPVLYFFIANMYGEPGSWPAYFNFMQRMAKENPELASDPSWRIKQKRRYKKVVGNNNHKSIPLSYGLRETVYRRIATQGKRFDAPVTIWWCMFEDLVSAIQDEYPDSPITHLFLFLTTLKNREFDSEELLMWMLCAYLEWIHLELFVVHRIYENNHCESYFVPLEFWMPHSHDYRLRTTRNRVLNKFYKYRDDRNFPHLLGEPRWHENSKKYRKLNVKHAMLKLKQNSVLASPVLEEYRYHALFSFVHFFEWMQFDMLSNKIPAEYIESSFSRLPEVASTVNHELYKYFTENNV